MITALILWIIYAAIWTITSPLRLFSDVSFSSDFLAAINSAGTYLATANQIFPITTLLTIFSLFLTIEGSILTYKLIMWVIRKVPGIS